MKIRFDALRGLARHVIMAGIMIALGAVVVPSPSHAASCSATTNSAFATTIANGHAYTKHKDEFVKGKVIDNLAFPDATIASAGEFATFLEGILDAPSENKSLANSRAAYWDSRTGTIIITNANAGDCGTAFRPTDGVTYYNQQK
ncbi:MULTISPECIES: hypothetical protein [unclassified Thalassospira]|uniref:hypothetical protein n=1 Tax=unclassified Thalassospira TaxID=2648997 RepID=UPI001B1578A3|nr:hypothetical protein [Thalassospira sp.]MBO6771276.1 hypothetical protein [Thalassospira sp.]